MQHKASFLLPLLLPSDCERAFLQLEKVVMVALICFGFQKHPRTNFPRHPRKWAKKSFDRLIARTFKNIRGDFFLPPFRGESQFHPHFAVYTLTQAFTNRPIWLTWCAGEGAALLLGIFRIWPTFFAYVFFAQGMDCAEEVSLLQLSSPNSSSTAGLSK